MKEIRAFLICPVRNVSSEVSERIKGYVHKLESGLMPGGKVRQVHWPARDTDQSDPIGFRICETNVIKIRESREVHVWYDAKSTGSTFDIGAVFSLALCGWSGKIYIANEKQAEKIDQENSKLSGVTKSHFKVLKELRDRLAAR